MPQAARMACTPTPILRQPIRMCRLLLIPTPIPPIPITHIPIFISQQLRAPILVIGQPTQHIWIRIIMTPIMKVFRWAKHWR